MGRLPSGSREPGPSGTNGKQQASMMRSLGVLIRTLLDIGVLSLAYFGAFFVRFDGRPPLQMLKLLGFTWPYLVGFELLVLYLFSVPFFAWRYVSLREAQRVAWVTLAFTAVLVAMRLLAAAYIKEVYFADYAVIPLG